MKHSLLIIFIFIFSTSFISGQTLSWDWAEDFGYSQHEELTSIARDQLNNIYITGSFQSDSIRFGSFLLTKPSFIPTALFLVKFDSQRNALWAKTAFGEAHPYTVTTDKDNNVIIGGTFYNNNLSFSPTISVNNSGQGDAFIAKYDSAGNILWANKAGGTSSDGCGNIGVDSSGNIFSIGIIGYGASSYFGSIELQNPDASADGYLARYDPAGNIIWAKNYEENLQGFALDQSGRLYTSGSFITSTVTFDSEVLSNTGGVDAYLVAFDFDGNVIWANSIGGWDNEFGGHLTTDKIGNVYMTGGFTTLPFIVINNDTLQSQGGDEIYIASYSKEGDFNWARSFGGSDNDYGSSSTCDNGSNIFLTSIFSSPAITVGPVTHSNNGTRNTLITQLKPNGDLIGSITGGGTGYDLAGASMFNDNSLYISGSYLGTGSVYGTSSFVNEGSSDIFIAKLNPVDSCNSMSSILFDDCNVNSIVSPGGTLITNSGIYYDTLTNFNNCDSIITISFVKKVINTSVTINASVLTSNETDPSATFQWYDCSTMLPITSATDASFTAFAPGSYYVEINNFDCSANSNCITYCPQTSTSTITVSACNSYTVPSGDTTYSVSGNYTDIIPNQYNCDSIITIQLSIDTSTAFAYYTSELDQVDSLTLLITNLATGNIVSYLWDFGDGSISNLQYPQHTYASAGNYQVCLTVYDSLCSETFCDSTSNAGRSMGINKINVVPPVVTAIPKILPASYKVYPNPTSDHIIVESFENNILVEVHNTLGQILYSSRMKSQSEYIKLPDEKGIYFVKLRGNDQSSVVRVIKQ